MSGCRAGRVDLSKLKFDLTPSGLATVGSIDENSIDLREVYARCHQTVFHALPTTSLGNSSRLVSRLKLRISEASCTPAMFMLTNMLAHQRTQPELEFYPNMLLGESAVKRVGKYRAACAKRYGTFDAEALETLMDEQPDKLEEQLLASETLAGCFVTGYKIWKSGPALEPLYLTQELRLCHAWCAIEPSYAELVLKPHLKEPRGSKLQREFRHEVCQLQVRLGKSANKARAVFSARERIMPRALAAVTTNFNFTPLDFEMLDKPVTDPVLMWARLGLAIQHVYCLRFLGGEPTPFTATDVPQEEGD